MNIIILPTETEVAERGADLVSRQLQRKADSVLGLASGITPVKMYRELVVRFRKGEISFARSKTFQLDEYVGLEKSNAHSYSYFMQTRFFNQIDIVNSNTHSLTCGVDADFTRIGAEYDDNIDAAGGIDLQILGMGSDGHIGFNDPGASFASRTRVVQLSESALRRIPRAHRELGLATTMGLRTIREARHILLVATGGHKAAAVKNALEGPMSVLCPASCLQFHSNVTVLLDEEAARDLELKDTHKARFQGRMRLLEASIPAFDTRHVAQREIAINAIYPTATPMQ